MNMKPIVRQCSRCRKHKPLAHTIRRMAYCEDCKDHAPTAAEFDNYLNEKDSMQVNEKNISRGFTVNLFGRNK
jgi:hypothetical protein